MKIDGRGGQPASAGRAGAGPAGYQPLQLAQGGEQALGRRIRFWVEALQGEEAMRQADERDVVVPAAKRAPLEVIEAERVLELAVVLLDAPAQLGEAHQLEQRRLRRQVGQPVLRRLLLILGPLAEQPGERQRLAVGATQADVGGPYAQGEEARRHGPSRALTPGDLAGPSQPPRPGPGC